MTAIAASNGTSDASPSEESSPSSTKTLNWEPPLKADAGEDDPILPRRPPGANVSRRRRLISAPQFNLWLLVDDFNIARYADDMNNDNFDVRAADGLNELIDELALQEHPLLDRRYTWKNSRDEPTLVRLDRAFINLGWGVRLFSSTLHSLIPTVALLSTRNGEITDNITTDSSTSRKSEISYSKS
jgi:hypothetical protein